MDQTTFETLRKLVYDRSGIALTAAKQALVEARIAKRMRVLGIRDQGTYLRRVLGDGGGDEIVHLIDAISTNVTSFFREPEHFHFIASAFSGWLAQGQRRFRFWSAGCSSGQEPHSLAMTLLEAAKGSEVDIKILATDISTKVLVQCQQGVYGDKDLEPVPKPLKERYFARSDSEGTWEVRQAIRNAVVVRRLNLAAPPFPMQGPLDAVFCRNVMIYFDLPVRRRLVAEVHRLLKRGGYLMVGHAESLAGIQTPFKPVKPSVYVKER